MQTAVSMTLPTQAACPIQARGRAFFCVSRDFEFVYLCGFSSVCVRESESICLVCVLVAE